jgi:hypothetical protein
MLVVRFVSLYIFRFASSSFLSSLLFLLMYCVMSCRVVLCV